MPDSRAARIDLLYDLKTQPRSGWLPLLGQNAPVPRVESVAEHTYGAYLLALLCLPGDSPEYDKPLILELLMVHDWAEAALGDYAHDDRTVWKPHSYSEQENKLMRELCPELYDRWRAMESGSTLEGLLAKDFDRLDSLLQLYRYHPYIKDKNEFTRFENNVSGKLKTAPAINLWSEFKPYFQQKYFTARRSGKG